MNPEKALIALGVLTVISLGGIIGSLELVARRIKELTDAIRIRSDR